MLTLKPRLQLCRSSAGTSTAAAKAAATPKESVWRHAWSEIRQRPVEYATIPAVAAFVGISTNWMGVKMLFYPLEYAGVDWYRAPHSPLGLFGWQGVVPTKTEPMAARLVDVITKRLLSLDEAFGHLEAAELARLLAPAVADAIRRDCGAHWAALLHPILPALLTHVVRKLQGEINDVLDLERLVMTAFVRDKKVLNDLFQKVGRVELKFLVESGFGFGFVLGLFQMALWAAAPRPWTLPVAGALVGYITNWVAIKLLFEPAEAVQVGPFVLQGLFERRQVEVSDEFGNFLGQRVLQSHNILDALSAGGDNGPFYDFLRRQLPYPIPAHILSAAVKAVQETALHPEAYPELHRYVTQRLDISKTLSSRLKGLKSTEFEDLLHPVFQEDEITLIVTGGILGAVAGMLQTRLGWGGTNGVRRAVLTIIGTLAASATFFFNYHGAEADEKIIEVPTLLEPILAPLLLRRKNTVVRVVPLFDEESNGIRR